jgi:hypothetical protein
MRSLSSRWLLGFLLVPLAAPLALLAQSSAADGPWTGQAMCVLSTRGQDYQEDQTHTWRLTGEPPKILGSTRHWPAVWSVEGSGTKASAQSRSRAASATSARWSIRVAETSAPIAIWEVPVGRVRIGSQHSPLVAKAITASTQPDFVFSLQEWGFPVSEDVNTATTIAGSSTRTVIATPAVAWQPPSGAMTTATCNWSFTKAGSGTISSGSIASPGSTAAVLANPTTATSRARESAAAGAAVTGRTGIIDTTNPGGVPVSGLRASSTFQSITLRWSCPQGASGYDVFGAQKGQPPVKLTTSPIGPHCVQDLVLPGQLLNTQQPPQTTYSVSFTHSPLPTAKEFTYTVRALYPNGGSADTPPFAASTSLFPPPVEPSIAPGERAVSLRWGQSRTPAGDASGYVVSRKLQGETAFRAVANVPAQIGYFITHTDGGVPPGRHEYVITPVDGEPSPVMPVTMGVPDLWNVSVLHLVEVDLGWSVWTGTPVRVMSSPLATGPWTDIAPSLAPGAGHLRFLATPGTRTYYKVVASYPGLTLESAPKLLDIAAWTPIIALRTQIDGNVVRLDWTCEPGIVEYHVMRLTNGGQQYVQIPSIVYPGLCNMSDKGIAPEIGPRGVEYIVVGYDRTDRAVRASRVKP